MKKQKPDTGIARKLAQVVDDKDLLLDAADLLCYAYDGTKQEALPEAVVVARGAEQVRKLVLLCNSERIPIYARGAGTNLSGGSFPLQGGVVLDFSRMNRILSVSPEDMVAVVEPGVVTLDLQQKVAEYGLMYPPDPASADSSTIGGNIAECAGGLAGVKYGVTRDYVLSLEAVTGAGELMHLGRPTLKSVAGLDLVRLVVGSEGTLALVTKATLKLIPMPEAEALILASFKSLDDLSATANVVFARRIFPRTMEFMDKASIDCVRNYRSIPVPEGAEALLIVCLDGSREDISRHAQETENVCREAGALYVRTALSGEERDELWAIRRAISPSLYKLAPVKLNEDICVPRSKVPEMMRRIEVKASAFPDLKVASFGHIGDGNIHLNVQHEESAAQRQMAHEFMASVMPDVIELGGSITGEHGVGNRKIEFLPLEVEQPVLELMREIKRVFDPNGILNPGKLYPPAEEPAAVAGELDTEEND